MSGGVCAFPVILWLDLSPNLASSLAECRILVDCSVKSPNMSQMFVSPCLNAQLHQPETVAGSLHTESQDFVADCTRIHK